MQTVSPMATVVIVSVHQSELHPRGCIEVHDTIKEAELANTISAEEGALLKGQRAVADAKQGIDGHTKKVRGQIQEMSGYWSGSAAGAFTQLMTSWDNETVKLNNILIQLENSMKDTETDQAQTEEAHQQAINKLGSVMSGA